MSEYPDTKILLPKHEIALSLANAMMRLGKDDWNGARHYIELARHDLENWLVVSQQRYKGWRVEEHVNGNQPTGATPVRSRQFDQQKAASKPGS